MPNLFNYFSIFLKVRGSRLDEERFKKSQLPLINPNALKFKKSFLTHFTQPWAKIIYIDYVNMFIEKKEVTGVQENLCPCHFPVFFFITILNFFSYNNVYILLQDILLGRVMLKKKNIELLTNMGLPPAQAKILLYLKQAKESTSKELEFGTLLRQPEVSIATIALKHRGFLIEESRKTSGKGRPQKIYKLKKPFNEILKDIEKEYTKKIKEMQGKITELQKLK